MGTPAKKPKFTDRTVAALVKPGRYRDPESKGLYLQVLTAKSRAWILRYTLGKRAREMGLGPYPGTGLAAARDKAIKAHGLLGQGIDPLDRRAADKAAQRAQEARQITFRGAATDYIASHKSSWRSTKHGEIWKSSLERYVHSVFGSLAVADIDVTLVRRVLDPIWTTKTETASRVRQRIEVILDWAATMGYRAADNPARWKGHLENLLPRPSRVKKVRHFPAIACDDLPALYEALKGQSSTAALSLRWTILTAMRTGEVIAARWAEIDSDKAVWTVPAQRMKGGKEHRVPLSGEALAVLNELEKLRRDDDLVFPGLKKGQHLSNVTMLTLLKRMNHVGVTVHGFRSTFRDWAAERTAFPREVAEGALAHAIESAVEAAYRRGDLFEKRTKLMEAWSKFVTTPAPAAKVTQFRRVK